MKSKIDEVIEEITREFKRCNADYNGSTDLDSSQVDIVITLEQLRPYVELGEYYYKKIGINTLQSMWSTEREYVKKLIKQIKEQKQ